MACDRGVVAFGSFSPPTPTTITTTTTTLHGDAATSSPLFARDGAGTDGGGEKKKGVREEGEGEDGATLRGLAGGGRVLECACVSVFLCVIRLIVSIEARHVCVWGG